MDGGAEAGPGSGRREGTRLADRREHCQHSRDHCHC